MKKVLMIVQNNFENEARVIKEATSLGKNGYQVKVLALHNDGLKEREEFEYFEVRRLHLSTRDKLSKTNRYIQLIKYYEFYNKCIKEAKEYKPDIVHIHDIAPLPIGVKLKKTLGCKLIYDSHELWSDVNGASDNPKLICKLSNAYESRAVNKSDLIITVSDSIARHLEKIYNLKKPVKAIKNVPYFKEIKQKYNHFRNSNDIKPDEKIMLYQGIITMGRGIEQMIEAVPELDSKIKLVILGDGCLKPKLQKEVKEKGLSNRVFFHDAVAYEVLLQYTNSADLGISLIQKVSLSDYYSLPNKLFEYIQAELPIICSNFPDMSEVVNKYGLGEVIDPKNVKSLTEKANQILANPEKFNQYKQNCINAKNELCWEKEEDLLLRAYNNI